MVKKNEDGSCPPNYELNKETNRCKKIKVEECKLIHKVKICNFFQPKYFEKQELELCGLHAANNLIQNKIKMRLFTKMDFDKECEIIEHNDKVKACIPEGYYMDDVIRIALEKRGLQVDAYLKMKGFKNVIKLMKANPEKVLGSIVLYKNRGCGKYCKNHFVTLILQNEKFLIIDSISEVGAYEIATEKEVLKYFKDVIVSLIVWQ